MLARAGLAILAPSKGGFEVHIYDSARRGFAGERAVQDADALLVDVEVFQCGEFLWGLGGLEFFEAFSDGFFDEFASAFVASYASFDDCVDYRGHRTSAPRKVFKLSRKGELCGVIVYSYPAFVCYGRRMVLPRMSMQQLNRQLSLVSRVVVHPKYRTIGLGSKLIRETLMLAGTPYVELIAVMAKYSPFAEKAGMTKIAQQQGTSSVAKVTNTLSQLGFDLQLLGSERYVQEKLERLNVAQIVQLKEAFTKNPHPRFKRALPLGSGNCKSKTAYALSIQEADLSRIAKLIKIAAVLSQAKVYLFWKKNGA
jgi:GNAT superfamily N-acetyltransferase